MTLNYFFIKKHFKSIIILFSFFLNTIVSQAQGHTNFIHLKPSLNNKNLSINQTLQDQNGYIWMAHAFGVEKYDGYNYYHIDIHSIFKQIDPNDRIFKVKKDSKNNIWILSKLGRIAYYDPHENFNEPEELKGKKIQSIHISKQNIFFVTKNNTIYKYIDNTLKKITSLTGISSDTSEVINIVETESGNIYISTNKGLIYNYFSIKKELTTLEGQFSNYPGHLYITLDLNENLWIGTETFGLYSYDTKQQKLIQNSFYKNPLYNIKNEMFISLFCDRKGTIWAGTDGGGLYEINPTTNAIELHTHHNTNKFSLSSNTIININEDRNNNIWILTNYGGVHILPKNNSNIVYHEGTENHTPAKILSIFKSKNKNLWVGTDGNGLTKITTTKNGATTEKQYFNEKKLTKGFYIQSITEDNKSNIWIGTYKNGLWLHNPSKNTFKKVPIKNATKYEATDIRTLYKDSKGRIWVGSNLSLSAYTENQQPLAVFQYNKQGLKGTIIESIIEDKNGAIWVGSSKGGLFKLEENVDKLADSQFKSYHYQSKKGSENTPIGIRSMTFSDPETLWLVNSIGKLYKYNFNKKKFSSYEDYKNFKNLDLKSVLSEDQTNIWLSTSNGILHFNTKDSITNTYHDIDGFQDNTFMIRSSFKDTEGNLYFGGVKGLNIFNPKKISKNKESKAKLYFNAIEVLNKPANSIISNQIPTGLNQLKSIQLSADQSSFSFRFSAVDNVLSSNYFYAYRLIGFNEKWIYTNKELLATYTNIPSGNYTFEVKAGSKKGIWDIPLKRLNITISQPFWKHPLAYLIYTLIFITIIHGIRKWYFIRRKLTLEELNNKKEKEIHDLKMDFFAKMSHEIQTPLTLISGPIDDMLSRAETNGNLLLKQRLQIISNNVKRLSRIVFELTTVRNKEFEKVRLHVTKNNLFDELHNLSISFKEQARFKNIDFTINCPKNLPEAWYDKDKLEHIIYNLLSNAFKFTPKEGNIQLIIVPINNKNSIRISISDSGPGIPKTEMDNIFTLFYQSKTGKQTKGTGIGLALTKELIDLHRGKIDITSSATEGTIFNITLPITEDAYLEEEKIISIDNTIQIEKSETKKDTGNQPLKKENNKTILVVEDNVELQIFLKDLLENSYTVIFAENGKEGLELAQNHVLDLILSDITMPIMDGIEMCEILQKNEQTKHIPIILLTARNSTHSKIQGLSSGAIEFINKPFNTSELLLKIKNIITSTEHIISKYKKEIISHPEIKIDKSQDEVFLENLYNAINSKIESPSFKMEELADALHMSYSVIYRKCQTLTGHSLIDLVRLSRLKKAAIVIAKYGYSVSEASHMVGFNDPKYFSKCFKKQFEKTPNTFKKEAQIEGYESYLQKHQINNY